MESAAHKLCRGANKMSKKQQHEINETWEAQKLFKSISVSSVSEHHLNRVTYLLFTYRQELMPQMLKMSDDAEAVDYGDNEWQLHAATGAGSIGSNQLNTQSVKFLQITIQR